MAYQKTDARLEDFIEKAFGNKEIRDAVAQVDVDEDYLNRKFLDSSLEQKAPKIWESATKEIEEYDALEKEYEGYLASLHKEEAQMRRSYLHVPRWVLVAMFVALSPAYLLILLWIFSTAGVLTGPVTLGSIFSGGIFVGLGMLSLLAILLLTIVVSLLYIVICRYLYRRYSTSKRRHAQRLAEIQRELGNNALGEKLRIAEQAVEDAVLKTSILPELRLVINNYVPSYDSSFAVEEAPGLAEVFDLRYEINTESKERLDRLIETMPGGSIGIAGPRGSGKTTLLETFCGTSSTTQLKGKPVLSIMAAAPVEYEAREFILHIFSSICQRLLEVKGKDPQLPWEYIDGLRRPPNALFSALISLREALVSILLGLILISTSLLLNLSSNPSDFFYRFFFGLGLFLVLLGVVGLLVQVERLLRQRRAQSSRERLEHELHGNDPLVKEAYKWLGMIRFQQSFSSGWAGSLKGNIPPIAVETKAEAKVDLSERQLSLPEIVDRYQGFLKDASQDYVIIIGIDEMDKIGSDEKAQSFLNEIKALFGLDSCFYLISVSESAMSSFERRGLPFRDVFDSSFDAIVHADYLNFVKAQRLLRRRVIGIPVPFLDLCHCMAGGLPRDLIRIARDMFDEHKQSSVGESDLSTLCSYLITSDLKKKFRAASVAAKDMAARDIVCKPAATQLIGKIRELGKLLETPNGFLRSRQSLLEGYSKLATSSQELGGKAEATENGANGAKREEVDSLSTELGVYLYYCATLLEFFGQEDFDPDTLKAAERTGVLDQLASARQFFATSSSIAESTIADFRREHNMDLSKLGVET